MTVGAEHCKFCGTLGSLSPLTPLQVREEDNEPFACASCGVRKVNMTISLAFLAPDFVKAAIQGRLPRGIGIARLCDLPIEWSKQYRALGLTAP